MGWVLLFVSDTDETEGEVLEQFENHLQGSKGTPTVYFHDKKNKQKAKDLQKAYQSRKVEDFQKWKL